MICEFNNQNTTLDTFNATQSGCALGRSLYEVSPNSFILNVNVFIPEISQITFDSFLYSTLYPIIPPWLTTVDICEGTLLETILVGVPFLSINPLIYAAHNEIPDGKSVPPQFNRNVENVSISRNLFFSFGIVDICRIKAIVGSDKSTGFCNVH